MFIEYEEMYKYYYHKYKCPPSFIPELFAVIHKLKPIAAHIIPADVPKNLQEIKDICNRRGLYLSHSDFKLYFDHKKKEHMKLSLDSKTKGGDIFIFVSSKKQLVKEAASDGLKFEAKADYYLGYPKCCIKYYSEVGEDQNLRYTKAINSSRYFSFLLNNFLHWEGPYYLISHFPCSYDCERSMEYAKRLLLIIEKEDPHLARSIKYMLSRPLLYNGNKSHIRFNGGYISGIFRFDRFYGQKYRSDKSFFNDNDITDYHNSLIDSLIPADGLKIYEKTIEIYSGQKVISKIKKNKDTKMIEWRKDG